MRLVDFSKYCTFIHQSAGEILDALEISYGRCEFGFGLDYCAREWGADEYDAMLARELDKYCLDEMIIADSVLCADIARLKPKAMSLDKLIVQDRLKHDLSGFSVASYCGANDMSYIGEIFSGAKLIEYDSIYTNNGYCLLAHDESLAYKVAASVIFDAYDSGADFMVVDDCYSFYMFDGLSDRLAKHAGRGLDGFYVLSYTELLALCLGIVPSSLARHRLKVDLV